MNWLSKARYIVLAAVVIVALILWNKWQAEYGPKPQPASQSQHSQSSHGGNSQVPSLPGKASSTHTNNVQHSTTNKVIHIKTNVLNGMISLDGGNFTSAKLLKYSVSLKDKSPVQLFNAKDGSFYEAQSGLLSQQLPNQPLQFSAAQSSYSLGNRNQMTVNLTWSGNGMQVVKSYTFTKGSYVVGVKIHVTNNTKQSVQARFYGQLLRQPPVVHHSLSNFATYTGGAYSASSDHYQKVKFKTMKEENLNVKTNGGWVAMVQHYFISAWLPQSANNNQLYSRTYDNNTYGIGVASPSKTVAAGQSQSFGARLYVGPANAHQLKTIAPYLDLTVDYGWLWFISELIFWVMFWIHSVVGNWGWSIVLVTLLIKLIFYPLSAKSYSSMAKMRQLQPRITALKEKHGSDRQAMGRATMELYRKEKVNPLSGCLPIVIQIPVFIGLYYMLMASVQLRQAPFIFWIHDLSVHDPYYVLPILMGLSMFLQQRLSPAPPDPTQAKIMLFLPLVFTIMFLHFPSGLVLYWLCNNCFSIAQQWYVMRKVTKRYAKSKK